MNQVNFAERSKNTKPTARYLIYNTQKNAMISY